MSLSTRLLPLGLCVAIAIGATGCPSSSSSSTPAATTTTVAKASDPGSSDSTTPDDSKAAGSSSSDDTDTTKASSGTGTVKVVDGEAAADKTVTFTADKTFDPEELTVGVGETFTFKAASGTHAVSFNGGSDTYTISGGLIESFQIDAAGTYTVSELLTEATMTVVVE